MDLYCERCGPGFWAEPLNALSNLSFLLAAAAAWWSARHLGRVSRDVRILIGLAIAIGVGSFLFHTFATLATMYLDVIPILLFQMFFIWVYSRRQMGCPPAAAGGVLLGLLVVSLIGLQFRDVLNGSLMYAPAWVLLGVFGSYHIRLSKNRPWQLWIATIVLFVSLVFRTIDLAVCDTLPIGTHFLWHLLNGIVIYLAIQSIILNTPQAADPTPAA